MSEDCHDSSNYNPDAKPQKLVVVTLTYPGRYCISCYTLLDEEEEPVNFCFECESEMLQQMMKEESQ